MLNTDRISQIMRKRGRNLAVALGAAGALAGAGGPAAHAATVQPAPAAHHQHAGKRKVQGPFAAGQAASLAAGGGAGLFGSHAGPLYAGTTAATAAPKAAAATLARAAPAPAAPAAAAAAPAPQGPSTIYDAVNPGSLPAGSAAAVYADGAYAASPAQVAGHPRTLWIDTNTTDPHANVLDVEPGDATPAQAATWVHQKLTGNPGSTAILYTMKSEWAATQDAVHALPASEQSHIKWWIADPTGVPHVVPGSDATQWYWGPNFDETSATAGF